MNSDMIKKTKEIHEKDEIFKSYIVILCIDSHDFYLLDSKDKVYHLIYTGNIDKFEYTNLDLNSFIYKCIENNGVFS